MIRRVSISLVFFFSGLIFSSWASRIPDIKDRFGLSEAELGGILFMLPLGSLSALPFAGWIVHRFNSKRTTIAALLVFSLVLLLLSRLDTVPALSATLFFFGVLGNMTNIAMNTQGLSVQDVLKKPILSSLHAMWSLGAFTAAALTGWLSARGVHMQSQFNVITLLTVVISLSLYFGLVGDNASGDGPAKVFALPNKPLMLLGLICFCGAMSEGAMIDWSALYFKEQIVDPTWSSTSGYTAFMCCMTIGRFAGDLMVNRFGIRTVLKTNGTLILVGMMTALLLHHPLWVMFGFGMVGFGVSSVIPLVYMMSAQTRAMAPSTALAAVSSVGFSGFLLGPPIIGFIAEEIGLRFTLWIVALLGVVIMVLTTKVRTADQLKEGSRG